MPNEIRARGGQNRGSITSGTSRVVGPSSTTTAISNSTNGTNGGSNHNNNSIENGFDPKHKEEMNAKLSDRRRERRQQRLARQGLSTNTKRRRAKLRNRAKMRTLMMIISSICCLCIFWLLGFYWFRQISSSSWSMLQ